MELTPLVTICGGGTCPTVYKRSDGTYVVQGYDMNNVDSSGRVMIEIPYDLLAEAVRAEESGTAA